jgi:CO/xanthine dehydrogenase FAD-binding subunit
MNLYFAPDSVADAMSLLAENDGARVVAGGTDLVVGARGGKHPLPSALIAIHRVTDLAAQEEDPTGARLGALTTHAWIESSARVSAQWSALADASALVGSPATRHAGTLGGNVMNASPAMDTGAPLLVLGADLELRSVRGTRSVSFEDLVSGPGRTTSEPDELLTAVHLPLLPPASGSAYVRLEHRRAMEIAIVGCAALVTLEDDGRVVGARIALSAAAPTCVRTPDAEAVLLGSHHSPELVEESARLAAAAVSPISDVRASAGYRSAMARVVVRRALEVAFHRAVGDVPEDPDQSITSARSSA